MAEGLVLLHLHGGTDGDVITVSGYSNVVRCRIEASTPRSHAAMVQRTKTMVNLVIRCHRSVNQSLG
jgi:hypothetical protein